MEEDEDDIIIAPGNSNPPTEVNQYGDHPFYAENINNLNLNIFSNQDRVVKNDAGLPYSPVIPARYDSSTRTITIGNEKITLPIELKPMSSFAPHEQKYINALCEVYAEKIQQAVTPDTLNNLSPNLRRHLSEQRKAYYSAESVQRSVREIFADGEKQFEALKTDAFDGISDTYYDDRHQSGYDRLLAVLDKITNTTLNKSSLMNIVGLIGNLEKKGICHILVNDDTIKSWVNIDE